MAPDSRCGETEMASMRARPSPCRGTMLRGKVFDVDVDVSRPSIAVTAPTHRQDTRLLWRPSGSMVQMDFQRVHA